MRNWSLIPTLPDVFYLYRTSTKLLKPIGFSFHITRITGPIEITWTKFILNLKIRSKDIPIAMTGRRSLVTFLIILDLIVDYFDWSMMKRPKFPGAVQI